MRIKTTIMLSKDEIAEAERLIDFVAQRTGSNIDTDFLAQLYSGQINSDVSYNFSPPALPLYQRMLEGVFEMFFDLFLRTQLLKTKLDMLSEPGMIEMVDNTKPCVREQLQQDMHKVVERLFSKKAS